MQVLRLYEDFFRSVFKIIYFFLKFWCFVFGFDSKCCICIYSKWFIFCIFIFEFLLVIYDYHVNEIINGLTENNLEGGG